MPVSKKQQACVRRYNAKNYDRIEYVVPKGKKEQYKAEAEKRGLSLNKFISEAVEKFIKAEP